MNNRYLCKAKDKDNGRWYEGYYLLLHDTTYCSMPSDNVKETNRFEEENAHHYIVFEQMTDWGLPNRHLRAEILPETLCQCTGKIDVYGKLIFEHEIVRERHSECIGEVKFGEHEKGYGWYIEWISEGSRFYRVDFLYLQKEVSLEVIGNIFDNPELLELGDDKT